MLLYKVFVADASMTCVCVHTHTRGGLKFEEFLLHEFSVVVFLYIEPQYLIKKFPEIHPAGQKSYC